MGKKNELHRREKRTGRMSGLVLPIGKEASESGRRSRLWTIREKTGGEGRSMNVLQKGVPTPTTRKMYGDGKKRKS